jgi:hypothetical protein
MCFEERNNFPKVSLKKEECRIMSDAATMKKLERLRRERLTQRLRLLGEKGPVFDAAEIRADLRGSRGQEEEITSSFQSH